MANGVVAFRPLGQGRNLGRILTELQGEAHAADELEWVVSLDSTIARAHQHAAGARRNHTGGESESHVSAA